MDSLPPEIVLRVLSFLKPRDIVQLRAVSRWLHVITSDGELWRSVCFEDSAVETIRKRSDLLFRPSLPFQAHPTVQDFRRRANAALSAQAAWVNSDAEAPSSKGDEARAALPSEKSERNRRLANWDPSYQDERVDWYGEYIARHGPLSMSWLQPVLADQQTHDHKLEVKGLGLYGQDHVIAPLEDGSVSLWNISHGLANVPRGAIQARSKPGILSALDSRVSKAGTVVAGSVSVDASRAKAYIAVQNYLQEIDLHTLSVSSQQRFPWAIATLSDIEPGVPLTVGTKSALHLYDPRQKVRRDNSGAAESIDLMTNFPGPYKRADDFSILTSGNFSQQHASLFQPGPTAIHHLFPHGAIPDATAGEIIVAGRFPSLLIYDRRTFPKLRNTFHSGAQLCSLASLPYAFRSLEADLMRQSQLSVREAQEAKAQPGDTLFACGEYQGKGSLEIYGLSAERGPESPDGGVLAAAAAGAPARAGHTQISTYKNRVSASRSKLLSVAVHGTRLVVSDGDGQIRWLERDGQTLVRRWNINKFGSLGDNLMASYGPSSGDVALKLLPVRSGGEPGRANVYEDELLVWTGERIGLMAYSVEPRFGGEDGQEWEVRAESAEEALKRREERVYGETMRRALETQADEVRWVAGLGLMG